MLNGDADLRREEELEKKARRHRTIKQTRRNQTRLHWLSVALRPDDDDEVMLNVLTDVS